jgi:hypothetical protein
MAAHSPSSPVIQPVLPDQPQAAWAPWLREIAVAVNQLGAKVLNGLATPVTVANGGTNKTSWTAGSVAFAGAGGSALQEDNASLFFDDTNNRLVVANAVVGTTTGSAPKSFTTRVSVADYIAEFSNKNNTAGDGGLLVNIGPLTSDTSSNMIQFADSSISTQMGTIKRNGTNAVAYNTTSDVRLKERIADSETGLDALMKVRVRDFNFKAEPDRTQQGFVAQELHEIYPFAVSPGADGEDPLNPWGVDYGRITPLLVRAIQQQQAQIERLRAEIAALK